MRKKYKYIIIVAVFAVVLPVLINSLMYINIPTPSSITASDWLNFWGGYLGGLSGTVAALVALWITFKQTEQQNAKEDKARQNSVMPIIDLYFQYLSAPDIKNINEKITVIWPQFEYGFAKVMCSPPSEDNYGTLKSYISETNECYELNIQNIGYGPAISANLSYTYDKSGGENDFCPTERKILPLGNLGSNRSLKFIIIFPDSPAEYKINFRLDFQDIDKRNYYQTSLIENIVEPLDNSKDNILTGYLSLGTTSPPIIYTSDKQAE